MLNDHDNDGEEEGENDGRGLVVHLQTRKGSDDREPNKDAGPETSASNTRSVDPRFWLGPEPNLLDLATEEQGVADILAALSSEEREQVQQDDTSMPIRHFRAEKVSGRFFFVSSSFVRHLTKCIRSIRDTFPGTTTNVSCFTRATPKKLLRNCALLCTGERTLA